VALITVSPAMTGGDRAQAWTRETLQVMGAYVLEDALGVPGAAGKIVDGRLADPATSARLRKLLDRLDEAMAGSMSGG
jgi:chromate reductase